MGRLNWNTSSSSSEGLPSFVKPISSKLDTLVDRISSLEESVQTGIETARQSQKTTSQNLKESESILSARHTPKTSTSRNIRTGEDSSEGGNIYKPNIKSPRSSSRNELNEDIPEKVPLQHTPSNIEF